MDFSFLLEGASPSELIRTAAVAIIACWALHRYVISRDIQQIINSNAEIKKDLNDLKINLDEKFQKNSEPISRLELAVNSLETESKTLRDVVKMALILNHGKKFTADDL